MSTSAGKKRVKSELIETLASGSINKKAKLQPKDPFIEKYATLTVEIPNLCLGEICNKFFGDNLNPLKFEITSYKSEYSGVAKTVCGETMFIEESKVSVVLTYEKDKREDLIKLVNERFPYAYIH